MDETRATELEGHVKTLQTQLEERTTQLRQSVALYEKLLNRVSDAAPALRQLLAELHQ